MHIISKHPRAPRDFPLALPPASHANGQLPTRLDKILATRLFHNAYFIKTESSWGGELVILQSQLSNTTSNLQFIGTRAHNLRIRARSVHIALNACM